MKNTGILRIQAFGARQSSPIEGVLVTVSGNGFTAQRITDETGTAADLSIERPLLCAVPAGGQHHPALCRCGPDCRKGRLPHRAHSGCADLRRAGHTGPAGDDPRDRRGSRRGKPAHSHPGAFTVHRRWRQRPGPHGELRAPSAGQSHHSQKHHGASGQACGIRPQCDCLLPGLYRQCCIQRSLPYLG